MKATWRGETWTRLPDRVRDESGGAIIMAILVSMVVLGAGAVALSVTRSEMRVTANHSRGLLSKYHSEAGLQRAVGLQNDLTSSPRFLFNAANYTSRATSSTDTSFLTVSAATAPFAAGAQSDGNVLLRVIGKDPVTQTPPYTVQSVASLADGSSATYQAVVDVVSLLDFAVFSDDDIFIAPNITISGRLYSGDDINLTGPTATFLQRVEYADQLLNPGNGVFQQGYQKIPPLPSIPSLVNLTFFENASKNAGVCSSGRGLYIGTDGSGVVDAQSTTLFRAYRSGSPAGYSSSWGTPGCRSATSCYAIDLSLFDFAASPVTYGGIPLVGYDGAPLTNFNGVIWVDGELHVWGHLGGRSPEENTVVDTQGYLTPPFVAQNEYSNNLLDAGEDGNNGGLADGQLDAANRGVSLGIYANSHIAIDHNIFVGSDSIGNPVRMALVSRNLTFLDGYSPKLTRVESAVLAVTNTWTGFGDHNTHRPNEWANLNGDQPPNSYVFDTNWDGVIQANNGMTRSEDRNETSMRDSWAIQNLGNLVVATRPSSGHWASHAHPRFYTYDWRLQTAEIPCYPTLPDYGIVPGSFTEVLNVP